MSIKLNLIPKTEFDRIENSIQNEVLRLSLIADMCRANALSTVKNAGSGHLGTSLSSMDIFVWLFSKHMNTLSL